MARRGASCRGCSNPGIRLGQNMGEPRSSRGSHKLGHMAHVQRAFQDRADSSWRSGQNFPTPPDCSGATGGPNRADARGPAEGGYVL